MTHEEGEQEDQRHEGPVAHPRTRDLHHRSVTGGGDSGGHAVLCRSVTKAPSMTTTTMITPWITVENARLHAEEEAGRREISPRMKIADDRPEQAAAATGQAHTAEHDGRDTEPGDTGREPAAPMPALAVSASPPSAAKSPAKA